jgi:catechol 2,3-dioxygenase-like lactoylglutathione lyase family enzyme
MLNKLFEKIDVVAYNVSDWARSKKFYCETLELPVAGFISDEIGWMELGELDGTHLALSRWESSEAMPLGGGATVVFKVADAYAAVVELRRRGVKCDDVIAIPHMVTYASFYDPDGNRLQIAGPAPM